MRHELLATDRTWMILKGAPCREATFLLKVSVSDVLLNLIPIPFDCELGSRYSRQCNFRQSVCCGIPNTDAVSVFQNRLSVRFFCTLTQAYYYYVHETSRSPKVRERIAIQQLNSS